MTTNEKYSILQRVARSREQRFVMKFPVFGIYYKSANEWKQGRVVRKYIDSFPQIWEMNYEEATEELINWIINVNMSNLTTKNIMCTYQRNHSLQEIRLYNANITKRNLKV